MSHLTPLSLIAVLAHHPLVKAQFTHSIVWSSAEKASVTHFYMQKQVWELSCVNLDSKMTASTEPLHPLTVWLEHLGTAFVTRLCFLFWLVLTRIHNSRTSKSFQLTFDYFLQISHINVLNHPTKLQIYMTNGNSDNPEQTGWGKRVF